MRSKSAQEIWEAALGELQIQISKSNYRTWFQKTVGSSYQDNQFVVGAPNTFVAEYLDKNQRSLIEKTLIGFTSPAIRVVFQVNGRHHTSPHTYSAELTIPPATQTAPPLLNPKYVFDSFIEGSSNCFARAAALAVAQKPGHILKGW